MIATTSIAVSDLISLTQNIATLNLGYLGVCVTIILFAGGFFYVFNFGPLQKSFEKQEGQLGLISKEVDSKIDSLNKNFNDLLIKQAKDLRVSIGTAKGEINELKKDAYEKIDKAEKKIADFLSEAGHELKILKGQNQDNQLEALWNNHWMWEGRKVPANALASLVEYMEKAIEYKKFALTELWLNQVNETLDDVSQEYKRDFQVALLTILSKIGGKDDIKEIIKTKLK